MESIMEILNLVADDPSTWARWAGLAISPIVLYVVVRYFGIWILETVMQNICVTLNTGILPEGKPISGPKWKIPNGQLIDKLLNGAAVSKEWQKYGPVYRIWAGPHPEIVITTPEDLKIFHSDSEKHTKPHNMNFGWFLGQVLGRAVGLLEGDEWRHRRQVFDPPFKHGASVARIDITEGAAKQFIENLPSLATADGAVDNKLDADEKEDKKSFTLHAVSAFTKFPFYLTAAVIYGEMSDEEEKQLWDLAQKHMALLPYFVIGGPYRFSAGRWVHPAAYRKLNEYVDGWREYNERIVRIRRAQGISVPLLSYWDEYEAGNVTLEEVLHTLDEMLMANLDVTTHVLTWLITLIADDKDAKQELREETAANRDKFQEYLTKTDTHLHRCFYESLRLRPLAIFNIGASAPSVKNFHGVLVKPNTMVLVDVLAINVRNRFWGPDSELFKPARFKTIKQSDLRYNLNAFGYGHRKCLGQYLGAHLIKAAVAHLFEQYDVLVTDGRKEGGDYKIDKSSWVPMADVRVKLTKLGSGL